jgi:hypothetical protein
MRGVMPSGINGGLRFANPPYGLIDPTGLLSAWGVIGFVGGATEATIGVGFAVATGWTGVGAVAGVAIALHGIDVAQAALRESDTFTSQGLQAAGLSQGTANAISTGISGAAFIAAGSPILPYSLFGSAISGGGAGTSLISATARGFVFPGVEVSNATSNVVLDALQSLYGTGTNAAAVGRAASSASVAIGSTMEASSAIQGGLISEAQGETVSSGQAPQISSGQAPQK